MPREEGIEKRMSMTWYIAQIQTGKQAGREKQMDRGMTKGHNYGQVAIADHVGFYKDRQTETDRQTDRHRQVGIHRQV